MGHTLHPNASLPTLARYLIKWVWTVQRSHINEELPRQHREALPNTFRQISAKWLIFSFVQILYAFEIQIAVFIEIFMHESARWIEVQNVLCKVDALMDWSMALPLLRMV